MFKAFGYKFFEENFDVSIGEEKITSSRFLKVDIRKIEQYTIPVATMETISENGTLTRMMSYFKNCEHMEGRLCPDWVDNGMRDQIRI